MRDANVARVLTTSAFGAPRFAVTARIWPGDRQLRWARSQRSLRKPLHERSLFRATNTARVVTKILLAARGRKAEAGGTETGASTHAVASRPLPCNAAHGSEAC